MSAVAQSLCPCVLDDRSGVRFCEEHHRYFRGNRELSGITSFIKKMWPLKPDYAGADAATLENARVRGVEVDRIFSAWLIGKQTRIPAGSVMEESKELFLKLRDWWNASPAPGHVDTQVLVADDEFATMIDVVRDGFIINVKCSYEIEAFYPVQLGLEAELYEATFKQPPAGIAILHTTKRYRTPEWIPLDMDECRRDARLLRETWNMVKRRVAK